MIENSLEVFKSDIKRLKERRDRAIKGIYNCIPLPFNRFRKWVPGTEPGKYIIITASQKIGKSKLCDFLYVYHIIFFLVDNPDIQLKVEVSYFTLEMGAQAKRDEFYCHLLYKLDGLRVSPTDLTSTNIDKPIDNKIFELLESERYQIYIRKFNEVITYIDDIKNPTGINKYCRDKALTNGHLNYKTIPIKDPLTGETKNTKIIDGNNPYTPNDPELYKLVIIDNYSNLSLESGMKKSENIDKMSKYSITLRNQLNYTIIAVQHQAQAQESIDNLKLNRLKPTSDGLADCKTTTRDANMVIGLYSPFKYGIRDYEGYDITKFRNRIRFLEAIEDRDYGANGQICPLFFDGAVSDFQELPLPNEKDNLNKIYSYINSIERQTNKSFVLFTKIKKIIKELYE